MEFICLAILGIITGSISALFGIGGGMIIVPMMLYFHYIIPELEFSAHDAIGISVMQMVFSSVFGTGINIFKKKNLDIKYACFLGLGGLIGASCSGILIEKIDSKHLTLIFLLVSLITFYKFAFGAKQKPNAVTFSEARKYILLVIIGSLTGVFAISLGIGGGVLLTPLLMYCLGFDTKKIIPLSLFFIVAAAITGVFSFIRHGIMTESVLHAGLILGSFSLVGVLIGSKLLDIVSTKHHRMILIVLYLISILATLNKVLVYYNILK